MSAFRLLRRCNLTPRGWRYGGADALVVSLPKSGRTWLRVFLQHYLCQLAGLEFRLKGTLRDRHRLPNIEFSHDRWEHVQATRYRDRLLGKYLIPERARHNTPIVLVLRDLRDVMVSLHFHLRKRGFACGVEFNGSLAELIRDPHLGAERSVDFLNDWYEDWHTTGQLFIWRYEDCHQHPETAFASVLGFLRIPLSDAALATSIEFAGFDSMRSMESSGSHWDSPVLRPGDPSDPESFKVRRGVVGGYHDYLNAQDLALIARAESRLLIADHDCSGPAAALASNHSPVQLSAHHPAS